MALLLVASQLIPSRGWAGLAPWPVYWFFQGALATGVWVIAHECGHGAFSKWQAVNDGVGLVLHSCLLVPYFSWKHSHRRHHSNTASLEKDEVFVPPTASELADGWQQTWFVRVTKLAVTLTIGWPCYLFLNVSGRKYERPANHFDPYSPIFSKRERLEVLASDAALGLVLTGLGGLARTFGWAWLLKVYVVPYLIVNAWLVTITLLQHTHPALPHFAAGEWDWLRGALSTVDRSYGFLDHMFHHIADTHVAHHLFSGMPHYHAREATAVLKPLLGPYYQFDARSPGRALLEDWLRCSYVSPDPTPDLKINSKSDHKIPLSGASGVFWYRSLPVGGVKKAK
ncbi:hypothetical protein WJX81_005778 [Elliptochloris bilobata]|uniref:Fatty acid desaturase domain-containing protein n=1 Tax=Elliptochloris bilobata TaxID=381761 RepID=A0AAW1QUF8_9CHLO